MKQSQAFPQGHFEASEHMIGEFLKKRTRPMVRGLTGDGVGCKREITVLSVFFSGVAGDRMQALCCVSKTIFKRMADL